MALAASAAPVLRDFLVVLTSCCSVEQGALNLLVGQDHDQSPNKENHCRHGMDVDVETQLTDHAHGEADAYDVPHEARKAHRTRQRAAATAPPRDALIRPHVESSHLRLQDVVLELAADPEEHRAGEHPEERHAVAWPVNEREADRGDELPIINLAAVSQLRDLAHFLCRHSSSIK
eukprot:CAMPEP_0167829550 /NCGR_PEP_ID=MMETSP0112_2-20121227/12265_1 /TAXON_ID=91324 /ORGANISM="Lotharella globosa, Strain CCCM811" /LENGTH=175 /DNA_ID=CAMNT_0007733343 /DNA_START=267 /DNA_END=793 /DNA_ORIENTATION=+